MTKTIIIAAALAASVFAALPASAEITSADCNYARSISDQRGFSMNDFSYNAQLLQKCLEQGK